jgi:hypothetical protein
MAASSRDGSDTYLVPLDHGARSAAAAFQPLRIHFALQAQEAVRHYCDSDLPLHGTVNMC